MLKRIFNIILIVFILTLSFTGGYIGMEATAATMDGSITNTPGFGVNILVAYDDNDSYLPLYQQLSQSLVVGANVETIEINQLTQNTLKKFDGVYLYITTEEGLREEHIKMLISYVENGGALIIGHSNIDSFPKDLTGVEKGKTINILNEKLSYPEINKDLEGIQKVAKAFEGDYRAYVKTPLEVNSIKANSATAVIAQGEAALFTINTYNKGLVMVLSDFLPNFSKYITAFDFQHRDEEEGYFQFFYAAGNWQFLNEIVGAISKNKYGFSMKKVMGPYGRPAMAWQNHYEVLSAIGSKDMINWIDYLRKYDQVPTFSLVRGSYEWGQWHGTITYHINQGDNNKPVFLGEEESSYYSNGIFLRDKNNDYLTFGQYPEYKSYYQEFNGNLRPYPYFIDWDGNDVIDLVVGTYDGRIGLLRNIGTNESPQYDDIEYLKFIRGDDVSVGENSAPTIVDLNGNGLLDIIVGNKAGWVFLLENKGDGFALPQLIHTNDGKVISMTSDAAPFAADLDGNGVVDLVLGDGEGGVYIYKGISDEVLVFDTPQQLMFAGNPIPVDRYAAPHIGDFNGNGIMDILIGDGSGYVHILLGTGASFLYEGKLSTERKNIYGENILYTGKNVVPFLVDYNNNGKMDLVTGQLSFALAYDTSDEDFIYRKELLESLEYAKKHHIPVMPHIYFHSHKDNQLEKREIELHMENFKKLGLSWGYTGTNQHTWRVNIDDPVQSFKNLMEYNVWYNFGFKAPNAPTDPTFAYDYLWPLPFMMMDKEEALPMVLFEPAPFISYFRGVYSSLAAMDVPLSFFEHIEYKMEEGTSGNDLLNRMINFAQEIRYKYNYAFMTEDQMAKTFINNFYTDYEVYIKDGSIKLVADTSKVPQHLAEEFTGTGGVKFELGEKYKASKLTTDGLIQYKGQDGIYLGVVNELQLQLVNDNHYSVNPISIIMVNSPIDYKWENESLIVSLNSKGMKQIRLVSVLSLEISGDDGLEVLNKDGIYTITHYGEETEVRIKINKGN
ncbi:FG-GAP repeat domain-containing protein [Alkaliphilus peptidifermentans]|uniref:Repeat domain-containing protein n=1 Tax=Alkaliphilus peptidifermentans DSM 18978 TaxID=1120976 RepID=A0A1G5AE47_9FIRM|nr:VCBS repeat-containing protein [Alkaliphilus peptidifermentans]SCX76121.1 Repeat domain-containing protein [Alkaliphilus peptidifermentans DSM 18978]